MRYLNPNIRSFDTSCFDGEYVTGDIDVVPAGARTRKDAKKSKRNRKFCGVWGVPLTFKAAVTQA